MAALTFIVSFFVPGVFLCLFRVFVFLCPLYRWCCFVLRIDTLSIRRCPLLVLLYWIVFFLLRNGIYQVPGVRCVRFFFVFFSVCSRCCSAILMVCDRSLEYIACNSVCTHNLRFRVPNERDESLDYVCGSTPYQHRLFRLVVWVLCAILAFCFVVYFSNVFAIFFFFPVHGAFQRLWCFSFCTVALFYAAADHSNVSFGLDEASCPRDVCPQPWVYGAGSK